MSVSGCTSLVIPSGGAFLGELAADPVGVGMSSATRFFTAGCAGVGCRMPDAAGCCCCGVGDARFTIWFIGIFTGVLQKT